jgi:hypothetical protein
MRALRLKIEYDDINGVATKIEIWQDGFTGSSFERDGTGSPLTIDWGDSGEQNLPVIYGSTATIRFYQNESFEFIDLFDADQYANLVKIYKKGGLFWQGFLMPEQWEENREVEPIPVEVVASDNLALLADIDFTETEIKGPYTIREIIGAIFDLTGLKTSIFDAIDWENTLSIEYLNLSVDTTIFQKMTCAEVLEHLFYGCRIFQREGCWYIISYSNFVRESMIVNIPAALADDFRSGDFRSGDFRTRIPGSDTRYLYPTTSDFWFEDTLGIEILPGIKQQTYKEIYSLIENFVVNGDFTNGNGSWTIGGTGITINVRKYDDDKYFAYLQGGNSSPPLPYPSKYIYQTITGFTASTSQKLRIKFDYGLMGAEGNSCNLYAMVKMWDGTDTYWAQYNYLSTLEDIELTWSKSINHLCLGAKASGGITYDAINAYGYRKVGQQLSTFDFYSSEIPCTGTLQVILFGAWTNNAAIAGSCFTNVRAQIVDAAEEPYAAELESLEINDSALRYVPTDLELAVGDFPITANQKKIYRFGLFDNATGTATHTWRRLDATSFRDFNEFRVRLMLNMMRTQRQNYQARLADIIPGLRCVIVDTDNDDKKLLENGISYDDRMQTIEGQFTEVLSITMT